MSASGTGSRIANRSYWASQWATTAAWTPVSVTPGTTTMETSCSDLSRSRLAVGLLTKPSDAAARSSAAPLARL
jgi:hypothetical protein